MPVPNVAQEPILKVTPASLQYRMTAAKRSGLPEWDGQQFDLNDPRIPEGIRIAASRLVSEGDTLWFNDTREGGEWWLMDDSGELIESLWLA